MFGSFGDRSPIFGLSTYPRVFLRWPSKNSRYFSNPGKSEKSKRSSETLKPERFYSEGLVLTSSSNADFSHRSQRNESPHHRVLRRVGLLGGAGQGVSRARDGDEVNQQNINEFFQILNQRGDDAKFRLPSESEWELAKTQLEKYSDFPHKVVTTESSLVIQLFPYPVNTALRSTLPIFRLVNVVQCMQST